MKSGIVHGGLITDLNAYSLRDEGMRIAGPAFTVKVGRVMGRVESGDGNRNRHGQSDVEGVKLSNLGTLLHFLSERANELGTTRS